MPLETLIKSIEKDAEKEITKIIDLAKTEANEIIEKSIQKGIKESKIIKEKGIKEKTRVQEKKLAEARRKARRILTNAKEEIVILCFNKIRQQLLNLDSNEYKKQVKNMIKKTMDKDTAKNMYMISSRKEDKEIAKEFNIEVKEQCKRIGGVILKSNDGSTELDLTFDFLIERKKEEIRIMIARKLFEDDI